MHNNKNHITVFEYQSIKLDEIVNGVQFTKDKLTAMQVYYGEKGVPYFSLTHYGIRFNEYVGVIQVGNLLIEVLPKADRNDTDETKWRDVLIGMLRASGSFNISVTSESSLKVKHNTILDLYFEMFIKETEYLLHTGLVKKYRKKQGNVTSLKGCLQFGKHIQQNSTHQERFYVRYTTYDNNHLLHAIVYKTICLLKKINTNGALQNRIEVLLLHFPEMNEVKISPAIFEKLTFNRKTQSYKKVINIARLLLLQYHPDVSKGRNGVLALMFDMNVLWEQFVYVSLRKAKESTTSINSQSSKFFWKPEAGHRSTIRPDIVINKDNPNCVVLDTKWKNLNGYNPSPDDLKQMYIYHEYYKARKVALVYPGTEQNQTTGKYLNPSDGNLELDNECSVISFSVSPNIREWQKEIYKRLKIWMDKSTTALE